MRKSYFFIIAVLLTPLFCRAQEQEKTVMEEDTTSGVFIHADPRLAILMTPELVVANHKNNGAYGSGVIRSAKGFRVQIYNGNDKNAAIRRKIDFMRKYPSVKTYMTYTQPIFRIKVGNFLTRKEAQEFMYQLQGVYTPLMVVPDYIVVNTFHQ
jgi:hypothetical protein